MAPEIISGKGYTYSVDLWSIGICFFEFMCGGVPFAEESDDPYHSASCIYLYRYEIYDEIIKSQVHFPSFLKDKKAKKLIEQFLNKTPEVRLGGGYSALKANTWFENFDWVEISFNYRKRTNCITNNSKHRMFLKKKKSFRIRI
jgi:cGMP-dependent protein kinase